MCKPPLGLRKRRGNLWANPIVPLPWMLAPLAAVAAFPNNGVAVSIEPLSILPDGLSGGCTAARGGLALLILTVAGRIRNGGGGGF